MKFFQSLLFGASSHDGSSNKRNKDHGDRAHERFMPPRELPQLITRARRPRHDRLIVQIALNIRSQFRGRRYRRALSFSSALATIVSISPR